MSFFKQFPKIEYDFNRTGVKQNMVDLFRSVRPLPSFLDNYSAYKFYEIKNGERPDIVSQRLYNNPVLHKRKKFDCCKYIYYIDSDGEKYASEFILQ